MKLKEYYDLKELHSITEKSERTLRRFKADYTERFPNCDMIKKKGKKDIYHRSLLKKLVPQSMLNLIEECRKLKNTIDCLSDTSSLGYHLYQMGWTHFGAVPYHRTLTSDNCFDTMHRAYEYITRDIEDTEVRLFFTTEPFKVKDGYHNHFVLFAEGKDRNKVVESWKQFFRSVKTMLITDYDRYQAGIFYNVKEGLRKTDWDILGTDLSGFNTSTNFT